MVGFTQLGETLEPEELGTVTGRLGELAAADVVEPPVRLVKLIGDAAMLVGPQPAGARGGAGAGRGGASGGRGLPARCAPGSPPGAAIAAGGRLVRAPGQPRQPDHRRARPAACWPTEEVRDALEDAYAWSYAGERQLKGIDDRVKLYRCRRDDGDGD